MENSVQCVCARAREEQENRANGSATAHRDAAVLNFVTELWKRPEATSPTRMYRGQPKHEVAGVSTEVQHCVFGDIQ
jgi:hypothetical protein